VTGWRDHSLEEMLDLFGLAGVPEQPFPTDGWSGSTFSALERDGEHFILKRVSAERDWIVRATLDHHIREAWLASSSLLAEDWMPGATGPVRLPYLDAAADDGGAAILMPDISAELAAWERLGQETVLGPEATDRLLDRIAYLHSVPWSEVLAARMVAAGSGPPPWCPIPQRLALLTRRSAAGYAAEGNPVAEVFLHAWDRFERHATPAARDLLERLGDDVTPLVAALARLPSVGLHGDIKVANVAYLDEGNAAFIDWQMTLEAPVALELGWFIVTNSAELPFTPEETLRRYHEAVSRHASRGAAGTPRLDLDGLVGDWDLQCDLAAITGLLLRGWRKGRDTDEGVVLGSGVAASDDLAWWCARAVEAADRRL
jgi:Ecdysteroid kinase-like family